MQKIKREILLQAAQDEDFSFIVNGGITEETVDEQYDQLVDRDGHEDIESEFRDGQVATGLTCDSSQHYESKSVAAKCCDGTWVGWTYWYGGGKHGEPESVPWMEDAYELEVTEQEKLVVVREFEKVGGQP